MPLLVNGQEIDDTIIDQEFSAIKAHYESMGSMSCCERDEEFKEYARNNIIFRAILTQEAQKAIDEPSSKEIDKAFEELKKDNGGDNQFYANMGLTPEQDELIRNDLALNIQVESFKDRIFAQLPKPTNQDSLEYYSKNKAQFKDEDEVRASHIFKSVREVEKREDVFNELCIIRDKLMKGADFYEIAKDFSDKPQDEIDLGFYKRGELMDEFEIITFSMKVGEVSPVFNTPHGFHLAKVTERKTGEIKPYEDVEDIINQELAAIMKDSKLKEVVDKLKEASDVKYIEPDDNLNDHN